MIKKTNHFNKRILCSYFFCFTLLMCGTSTCRGSIIYEFFNNNSGTVTGSFDFDSNFASGTTGWSVSSGTSLSSILFGGLSGIVGDFGSGFVPAVSGDLVATSTFGSNDGSKLDFGVFADAGGGPIVFADGSTISMYTFNTATPDIVTVGNSFNVPGEFRLVSNVPEQSSAVMFGVFAGVAIFVRRRPRQRPV